MPSGFVQPEVTYRATDRLSFALGGNVFEGSTGMTCFGQLDRGDNLFLRMRFHF
jgi:hypothetical protein